MAVLHLPAPRPKVHKTSAQTIHLTVVEGGHFEGRLGMTSEEPWWVTWTGGLSSSGRETPLSRRPAINRDVHDIADRAKHGYATGTQRLATMQYRLGELAGTGQLDPDESMRLQHNLVSVWEALYSGTVCAVRDADTDDSTWDEADNTYSDGRTVMIQIRIEPWENSDFSWEHNRFMLGEGAVNDHPRGTIWYISPLDPERDQAVGDSQGQLSTDFEALRKRLLQAAIDSGDEADSAEIDGEDEI